MRKFVPAFMGLAMVVTLAAPQQAVAWSTQGGEIVPMNQYAGTVGVGYPGLRGMVHIPVMQDFEIAPSLWFYFGQNTAAPVVGDIFSVQLKYRVFKKGHFQIALAADPGVVLNYHPAFGVGIRLGLPQLMMSWVDLIPKLSLHFGFKMPITISVHPAVAAEIPLLANFGVEYSVNNWINVFGYFDMGVALGVAGSAVAASFSPNVVLGAAFKF
ncbi:MAG: hypothetical protein GXP54_08515 [Deltaproteobacteria bacterium]|nr:hypothetical protein [Deltaproteobacteria bacterium]